MAALYTTAKKWEKPKWSSRDKWKNTTWYPCKGVFSPIKGKERWCALRYVNRENTMPRGGQTWKATHCAVLFAWNVRPRQTRRERVHRRWLQGRKGTERLHHRVRPRPGSRQRLWDQTLAMPAQHRGRAACHWMAHFKVVHWTLCGFHLGYSKNAEWWLATKP